MPSSGRHPARALPAILGLALVGMLGTAIWMTLPDFTERVGKLDETAQWVTWVVVLAIQVGIFLAVVPALYLEARLSELKFAGTPTATLAVIAAFLAVPLATTIFFDPAHPVQEHIRGHVLPLIALGTLVAALAAAGVVRTHRDIESVAPLAGEGDPAEDMARFVELRRRLRLLGGVLALLIALAVLGAGAQRNAVVATETARAAAATVDAEAAAATTKPSFVREAGEATAAAAKFGVDIVWSYGLYYSFVLVLVYLPPYLSLMTLGRTIRDRHAPSKLPSDPSYEQRKKERDAWDEELQLKMTTAESLRAAALVLVPLVSSLASTLLGGVKVEA